MLNGKNVIIIGGTGSLGNALTDLILKCYDPSRLVIFSRDELKQWEMRQRFDGEKRLRFFIGDVRDQKRLQRAFQGVNYVIHTAAMKQVPASEYNPFEAIKTNILGAQNIIGAAMDQGIERVIALSTDKAVNPINLYGATKLCSDKLFLAASAYVQVKKTIFSVVRYGNVLMSRGSVIPVFLKQKETGTLRLTHPDMTRFWITLPQAAKFVLSSLEMMKGCEVFVPKIPSMKLIDLAKTIGPECEIEYTGIRPGEKLHEILIPKDEVIYTKEMEDRYVVEPVYENALRKYSHPGKPLPDRWEYNSQDDTQRLTPGDLKKFLD